MTQRPKKLFHQVRGAIRLKHYSYPADQSCVNWIILHISVHTVPHPAVMTTASLATIPANDDNLRPSQCPVRRRLAWANPVLTVQIRSCIIESVS